MALNIKDQETDRLARELAELTEESITEAVKGALCERLERERRRRGKQIDWAMLRERQADFARLPVVDDRGPDELLDYDEAGLSQ